MFNSKALLIINPLAWHQSVARRLRLRGQILALRYDHQVEDKTKEKKNKCSRARSCSSNWSRACKKKMRFIVVFFLQ